MNLRSFTFCPDLRNPTQYPIYVNSPGCCHTKHAPFLIPFPFPPAVALIYVLIAFCFPVDGHRRDVSDSSIFLFWMFSVSNSGSLSMVLPPLSKERGLVRALCFTIRWELFCD